MLMLSLWSSASTPDYLTDDNPVRAIDVFVDEGGRLPATGIVEINLSFGLQ